MNITFAGQRFIYLLPQIIYMNGYILIMILETINNLYFQPIAYIINIINFGRLVYFCIISSFSPPSHSQS